MYNNVVRPVGLFSASNRKSNDFSSLHSSGEHEAFPATLPFHLLSSPPLPTALAHTSMEEANLRRSGEFSDLMAQSPPALLPASPPNDQELSPKANSVKRTRADIATPRRPGSDEARRQEEMEYIETPARAPPAMKRFLRSESPTPRRTRQIPMPESLCRDDTPPPPKLSFGEEAESVFEVTQRVDSMQVAARESAHQNGYETVDAKLVGIAKPEVEQAAFERSTEPDAMAGEHQDSHMEEFVHSASLPAGEADESTHPAPTGAVRLSDSEKAQVSHAETVTTKILSDAELMTAASMPLPDTPQTQALSPGRTSGEFQGQANGHGYAHVGLKTARVQEYEEKIQRQTELREMLLQALKDDYAAKEREFEAQLAEEQARFAEEMRQQREQASADAGELIAADQRASKLLEQKEAESNGLSRELGKLTLERNRLQESLDEATARADALSAERDETQKRVDTVMAENLRLEELNTNLRNDVVVAEERSTKFRDIYDELVLTQQDLKTARAQLAKSDARSRSQSIQLESTKRQNAELLELLDKVQGPF
ncbi:hypothetical protein DL89DRAFT_256279 [Linderina pennispora]|uniref:Transforming acidic coiled-coil-containing protein C-terminal domain-containing protein n=1 Tax=Linderina pennispora TaxID=61395 RepID=A0A1Y1WCG3_9FUNG|nr:uncharacterized protein DL89DRAFT_256279 [Linderina pennispora]ORX71237.1 hypothetical protein DL89DRAFT_256279 [Linderina pennispora]